MKYVFLVYQDEQGDGLSPYERDLFETVCQASEQELRQSGHLLSVEGLQASDTAIMVQLVNGEVSLRDGPFTETRRELIQLFFIDARDLNEAIRLASKMPQARRGPIEVRPVLKSD